MGGGAALTMHHALGNVFDPSRCFVFSLAKGVFETASALFDTAPVSVDAEIEEALRSGVSLGLVTFGPNGEGKTTAMWGSPALGEDAQRSMFCGTHVPACSRRNVSPTHAFPFSSRSDSQGPEVALAPRACGELFGLLAKVSGPGDEVVVACSFLRVSAIGEMTNDCLHAGDLKASGLGHRLREAAGNPSLAPGDFFMEGLVRKV